VTERPASKVQGSAAKPPNAGKGRKKGVPNKTTALLKDAILKAAADAGGAEGLVGYLTVQATANPGPFMALLGKVLPMQVTGEDGGPIRVSTVERVIVRPEAPNPDS
jgi:hypothetical protein